MSGYRPFIGLEIHVELTTQSKMFCGCCADHFHKEPNTQTCPVCLGLPGALPVPNKKAIDWTVFLGLVLGCRINKHSYFERKQYFYPDLPKGFQISQYERPFCFKGWFDEVNITRVHLEEDTGKLIHRKIEGEKVTLIDFNRCGVPLVEIVTEPEIKSAEHAKEWLKKLQRVIRSLSISDCDMEKGSMRLEANVSVSKNGKLPSYKVELKNINSFRFVEKAIEFEIQRQTELFEKGQKIEQETRGFESDKGVTYLQRSKEEAFEYRYFPEPDIPPIVFTDGELDKIRKQIPELPEEKRQRFVKEYSLNEQEADYFVSNPSAAQYFEVLYLEKNFNLDFRETARLIINKKIDWENISPADFKAEVAVLQEGGLSDQVELAKAAKIVVDGNPKAVADYRKGKTNTVGFLVGQMMKKTKVDPNLARQELLKILE